MLLHCTNHNVYLDTEKHELRRQMSYPDYGLGQCALYTAKLGDLPKKVGKEVIIRTCQIKRLP